MKIKLNKILYFFLMYMLFVAIIGNKISLLLAYVMILFFIFIIFLFFNLKTSINKNEFLYVFLLILLFLNFMYEYLEYHYNNLYYIQFYGSQLFFFIFFSFTIKNINLFFYKYAEKFFQFFTIILFLSIFIDWLLLKNGLVSYQLMYKENLKSYEGKPLGLFGQSSINSTYIIISYLLYLAFKKEKKFIKDFFLFILVTISIILENSGSGYVAYLMLLFLLFSQFPLIRFFLLPIGLIIVIFVIINNFVQKISLEYLIYNINYFSEIFFSFYMNTVNNASDILFGINGNINFPIDFGPLFMIAKVGLLYTLFYFILYVYIIIKSPNEYIMNSLLILLLTNIHYPTIFYPIMNIILAILFLFILNNRKVIKCVE